ncbi:hypothetical protein D3C81_1998410 [compost metagenome]
MPTHIQIPELRAVFPLGCRRLIGRAWVLRQALLDQLNQRLIKAPGMLVSLQQCCVRPQHGNQLRRSAGDAVGGRIDDVGVGYVGLDIENRRAIQQIDARDPQAVGFDPVQFHH